VNTTDAAPTTQSPEPDAEQPTRFRYQLWGDRPPVKPGKAPRLLEIPAAIEFDKENVPPADV
jgi:hypothetical protein